MRSSFWSFIIQAGGLMVSILANFLLARWLGPEDFGAYVFAYTVAIVLSSICLFGLSNLIVREVAALEVKELHHKIKGLLKWAVSITGAASIGITAAGVLISLSLDIFDAPNLNYIFPIALAAIPFLTYILVQEAILRGFRKIILSQWAKSLRQFFLIFVIILLFFIDHLDLLSAVYANLAAIAISFFIGIFLVVKIIPDEVKKARASKEQKWFFSSFHFFLISLIGILNMKVDVLMLGFILDQKGLGTTSVGVYSVAARLAELLAFILVVINSVLAPIFAKLYAEKNLGRLQRIVTISARAMLLIVVPVFIIYILFGTELLALFGSEFRAGYYTLIFLSAGQMINVATGSVGYLLLMSGNEKYVLWSIAITLFVNATLNIILIPLYLDLGAAIATAIGISFGNILLSVLVYKKTGIFPTAIGPVFKKTDR